MTLTSTGAGLIAPPESSSDFRMRSSQQRLMSRCSRLPKSLNIVDPPESTTAGRGEGWATGGEREEVSGRRRGARGGGVEG